MTAPNPTPQDVAGLLERASELIHPPSCDASLRETSGSEKVCTCNMEIFDDRLRAATASLRAGAQPATAPEAVAALVRMLEAATFSAHERYPHKGAWQECINYPCQETRNTIALAALPQQQPCPHVNIEDDAAYGKCEDCGQMAKRFPCDRECHYQEPYGFVPEADCPVHDVARSEPVAFDGYHTCGPGVDVPNTCMGCLARAAAMAQAGKHSPERDGPRHSIPRPRRASCPTGDWPRQESGPGLRSQPS